MVFGLTADDCRTMVTILKRLEDDAVRRTGGEDAAKRYGELAEKLALVQVGIVSVEQRQRALAHMRTGG